MPTETLQLPPPGSGTVYLLLAKNITIGGTTGDVEYTILCDSNGNELSANLQHLNLDLTALRDAIANGKTLADVVATLQANQPRTVNVISGFALDTTVQGVAKDATVGTVNTNLGTDGATPPSIPGTGVRGWLRSIYDRLVAGLGRTWTLASSTDSVNVGNFPATQPVSGTVTANIGTTNGLALDTTVAGITTSLGTDGAAPPEGTGVRGWLDSIYDIQPVTIEGTAIPLTSRSASFNGTDITNTNCRGVRCYIVITVDAGAAILVFNLQEKDPVSGQYVTLVSTGNLSAPTTTPQLLVAYPGARNTPNQQVPEPLARTWRVTITYTGTGSYTASVGYCLIP